MQKANQSLVERILLSPSTKNKPIRVLYDISVLGIAHQKAMARTGVFRVVENLARGLWEAPECQLYFCSTIGNLVSTQCQDYLSQHPQFNQITLQPASFSELDIFHSPFHTLPDEVRQKTRLLTIHDLIPLLYPRYFVHNETELLKKSLHQIQANDWLISVSHSTKNDLCNYVGFDPDRIFVTHLAANPHLFYSCQDKSRLVAVRKKYGIGEEQYFLSLSTLEPRKNITQVINCFGQLIQQQQLQDLKLVLVGAKGWQYEPIIETIKSNKYLTQKIILTGYVDDEDLAALYSGAIAFLYLSLYEGFGLPPLEAMQCGIPVITSNTSSLPEVVGNAGLMHKPGDTEGICHSMLKLYQNSCFRDQLALKSQQQAQKFTWEKCVQQTIDTYQNVLSVTGKGVSSVSIRQPLQKKILDKTTTKIIVDGIFFQLHNSGIARLWKSVLKEWSKTEFSQHLLVLNRGGTAPKISGISSRVIPEYNYDCAGEDSEMLERICQQEKAELFISSYYTTPIFTPSVFMAYDLVPEVMKADLTEPRWREKHHGIYHASAYISISENTAQDLIKFFPKITREQIKVAHCGVESTFFPAKDNEIKQFKVKYNLNFPYFLIVGERFGFNGYKNVRYFLQAFATMPENSNLAIIFTGGKETLEAELLELVEDVETHVLQLNDEELKAAYSGAIALVYPSRYEGFGLPILEAMACACPVITCHNSSIPEVAAEAALYVSESDINELVEALYKVQDPELRNSLIASGLAQAKKFSWSNMATIIADTLIKTARDLETGICEQPSSLWREMRQLQIQLEIQREADLGIWKNKNAIHKKKLKDSRLQSQKLQAKLEAKDTKLKQLQIQLKQTRKELKRAQNKIKEIENSKFWIVPKLWFKLKRKLGILAKE